RACMDDDFNTAGAIGWMNILLTDLNRLAHAHRLDQGGSGDPTVAQEFKQGCRLLKEMGQILGLFEEAPSELNASNGQLVTELVQLLLDLRAEARDTKNFA